MSYMKSIITSCVVAASLAGCVSGAPRANDHTPANDYLAYAGAPIDSFHINRLDNWQVVGPNQLVLWSTPWQAYLVTVWSSCSQLPFANRLAVTSTVGSVSKFESIVLRNGTRCPIDEIRPIDLKQMQADRALRQDTQA